METKTNHPATFDSACPSRQVLEMLSNKWTLLVMRLLSHGTHRYRELQREANGVTQKMLTQTLRELEKNGIVKRTAFPVVPPKVEYILTPIGETLIEALKSVGQW